MRMLILVITIATGVASVTATASDEIALFELYNYHEYSSRLASSGQPARDQLPAIAGAGIQAIINLAPATSRGAYAEEGTLVRQLGMNYVHIPVVWDNPTSENRRQFLAAMKSFAGKRVLVHCVANARASAFIYLWRIWQAGDDKADAYQTLIEIWDKNAGHELDKYAVWRVFVEQGRIEQSSAELTEAAQPK